MFHHNSGAVRTVLKGVNSSLLNGMSPPQMIFDEDQANLARS